MERQRSVSMGDLRDVGAPRSLVRLWDPIDSLCDAQLSLVRHDVVLFTDALHLTARAGRRCSTVRATRWPGHGPDERLLALGVQRARHSARPPPLDDLRDPGVLVDRYGASRW
jgi:hypothetical protein